MRAIEVRAFGGVDQLALGERPRPEPGPEQVSVRVMASGLNFSDLLQRAGEYVGGPRPPFVPGSECAGIIEASQERVAILVPHGAQAEYVVARREQCLPIPPALSFEQAAGLPVSYLTAYHALVTAARAEAGEDVLVLAAGGALGTATVQIARLLGLRVLAVASTRAKRERALELGASVALGYEELRGLRADVVIDGVGGSALQRALRTLRPLGRAVLVGCSSGQPRPLDSIGLIFRSQAVVGLHLNAVVERPELVRGAFDRLLAWLEKGELQVQIGHVLPFERVAQAHELQASRERMGKVVLVP